MLAEKRPIEVLAYRYFNVILEEFLKLLESGGEPVRYEESTKTIYIQKERGEVALTYGNWVIHEVNTDSVFWAIDSEIFHKTYERVPDSLYTYRKKVFTVECVKFKSLSYKDIVEVLNFFGYKAKEVPEIIQRDDMVDEVKSQGYLNINTLEGVERLYVGEILVKGIDGEFYPVSEKSFNQVYKIIEE